jgi:hypothetical protein
MRRLDHGTFRDLIVQKADRSRIACGDEMQAWPVGKAVGNVRNQGPQLMERIDV